MKRFFAFFTTISILTALVTILVQTKNPDDLANAIQNYHILKIYKNVHISGNELRMSYLGEAHDNPQTCYLICMKDKRCIAANYYKGNPDQKHKGQCWLFSAIDPKKVDLNQPCCELVIKSNQVNDIKIVDSMIGATTQLVA